MVRFCTLTINAKIELHTEIYEKCILHVESKSSIQFWYIPKYTYL